MPAGLAMIAEVVPEDRRPGALAVYTGVGQAFAIVGPLVGGLCAQYLGWRWGFLVNVRSGSPGSRCWPSPGPRPPDTQGACCSMSGSSGSAPSPRPPRCCSRWGSA
jgi:MFS family permease